MSFQVALSVAASLTLASNALADHEVAHAAMDHSAMNHGAHAESATADEHAAHQAMLLSSNVKISSESYTIPDVELTDQRGQAVDLPTLLASDKPLAINFIFTTCTTICPVMTATWVQLEDELAGDAIRPELVSISIDPAYDTPTALSNYAELFGASWTFLTGSESDIARTLQQFDASRGSKVNHFALTLMRPAHSDTWTRVEGLTSAKELARVWRDLTS